ncbi:hypothetical protein CW707_00380 [Candidatus Bathyarchaeota archaeon]|nr:MAG: hypothetical protein CW707_00380 [Candidatus Bathyarchaeota archaeon]
MVNPFKTKEAEAVLKEALQHPGPAVIVFRAPCALMMVRDKRRKGVEIKACKITDQCTDCMACIKLLGCPALTVDEGKVRINEALCVGCGLCASVCPYNAIACSKTD